MGKLEELARQQIEELVATWWGAGEWCLAAPRAVPVSVFLSFHMSAQTKLKQLMHAY
jgi:hypothetical protein